MIDIASVLEKELLEGELVLWQGQPETSVFFTSEDKSWLWITIPHCILSVLYFRSLIQLVNSRPFFEWTWSFDSLDVVMKVLLAFTFLILPLQRFTPFIQRALMKKKTHYLITNQRVMSVELISEKKSRLKELFLRLDSTKILDKDEFIKARILRGIRFARSVRCFCRNKNGIGSLIFEIMDDSINKQGKKAWWDLSPSLLNTNREHSICFFDLKDVDTVFALAEKTLHASLET